MSLSEFTLSDYLNHLLKGFWNIVFRSRCAHLLPHSLNFLDSRTKNEDILITNFFVNFNIGSVHGSDDKSSIHNKLHIRSSRRLCSRSWNVLREFSSWDDNFSIGYAIVGKEQTFQVVFGFAIIVDDVADFVDEFDDLFGVEISWSSFSWEHNCSGDDFESFLGTHFLYRKISVNNVQDIHELPFVFVNSLNLDVEHWVWIDLHIAVHLYPFS